MRHLLLTTVLLLLVGAFPRVEAQTRRPVTAPPAPRPPKAAAAHRTATERTRTAGVLEHSRAYRMGLFGRRGGTSSVPDGGAEAAPPSPDRAPAPVGEKEALRRARRLEDLLISDLDHLRTYVLRYEVLSLDPKRGRLARGKVTVQGDRPERGMRRIRVVLEGDALGTAEYLVTEGVAATRVYRLDDTGAWTREEADLNVMVADMLPLEALLPHEPQRYRLDYLGEVLHDGALSHRVALRGRSGKVHGVATVRESDRTVRGLRVGEGKRSAGVRLSAFETVEKTLLATEAVIALPGERTLRLRRSAAILNEPLPETAFLPEL